MKRLYLSILYLLFCSVTYAQKNDCSIYRKGYYLYNDYIGDKILIDRHKKYQYEFNTTTKIRT